MVRTKTLSFVMPNRKRLGQIRHDRSQIAQLSYPIRVANAPLEKQNRHQARDYWRNYCGRQTAGHNLEEFALAEVQKI